MRSVIGHFGGACTPETCLHWAIAVVGHFELDLATAFAQFDRLFLEDAAPRCLVPGEVERFYCRERVFGWAGKKRAVEGGADVTIFGTDGIVDGD